MRSLLRSRFMAAVLKRGRLVVAAAATVVFIFLLLRTVDLKDVGETIRNANPWYLLPITAVYCFRFWLRAFRWRHLVRHLKPVSTKDALPRVILSQSANTFLPFQLGYVVMVQIMAEKFGFRRSTLFGAEAVERMMDGVAFAIFLVIAVAFLAVGAWFSALAGFMAFGVAAGMGLAWWFTRRSGHPDEHTEDEMRTVLARLWDRSYHAIVRPFLTGMRSLQNGRQTLDLFGITMAIWFSEALLYWLVGLALDIDAGFLTYVFIVGAANVGAAIPSTQASVGPFEYFTQQGLVATGVGLEVATAFAFSLHGLLIAPALLAGPIAAWYMKLSWRDFLPGLRGEPAALKASGS